MPVAAAHAFPKFIDAINQAAQNLAAPIPVSVLLTGPGTVTWNATTQGYTYVQDLLTGAALTEISGAGYSPGGLACSGVALNLAGPYDTLVVGVNPTWPAATFTADYAIWYSTWTGTGYATYPLIAYWDLGGDVPVSSGTFALDLPTTNGVAGALAQWQVQ